MQASKASTLDNSERPITVTEGARRLGLQPVTVRAWIARRRIAAYKLGRAIRIDPREIDRVLNESLIPAIDEEGTR